MITMKQTLKNLFTILVALIVAAGFGSLQAKVLGKIALVIGKVQVKEGGAWKKARIGMPVTEKMSINTGMRSKVIVKMNTGTRINIKASTMMKFNSFGTGKFGNSTTLNLRSGGISAIVAKLGKGKRNHFRIRTPTAVAGVRGSRPNFESDYENGDEHSSNEHQLDSYNKNGQKTETQKGGKAKISKKGTITTSNQNQDRESRIDFSDESMGDEEKFAMFESFDPTGLSPEDMDALFDLLFDEFDAAFGFEFEDEIVTIAKQ